MTKRALYVPKNPLVKSHFAKRLAFLRKEKGLTQKELSEMIGVARKTYALWEKPTESSLPNNPYKIAALCEVLDTTIDYLLCGLFEQDKESAHSKGYRSMYEKYKGNADFYLLVKMLMTLDDDLLSLISVLGESVFEKYKNKKLFK